MDSTQELDLISPEEDTINTSKLGVAIIKYVVTPLVTGLLLGGALTATKGCAGEPEAHPAPTINSTPLPMSNHSIVDPELN
jgi:hypothetical protein